MTSLHAFCKAHNLAKSSVWRWMNQQGHPTSNGIPEDLQFAILEKFGSRASNRSAPVAWDIRQSVDELRQGMSELKSLVASTHNYAEIAAVNAEKAASKPGPRKDFTPKEKAEIAICYYLATGDGLDLFDGTQLVHSDGTWTTECEFDHVNANSNVKRLNNCMPYSKRTHRLKGDSALSIEQRERLNRYHLNVLDQLDKRAKAKNTGEGVQLQLA